MTAVILPRHLPHGGPARPDTADRSRQHAGPTVARLAADLDRSDRRFRSIVERTTDGVLVVDEQGTVLFANPAAEKILGRHRSKIVRRSLGFPCVAGDTTELELVLPGGQLGYAEMRVVPSEWDGAPALLVLLHDITERRQAELDMIRMNAELTRSNEELQAFAGVVAHDLKQPIAAIGAVLHAFASGAGDDPAPCLAASATATLADMARLVDAVLDYARANSAPLTPIVVDCAAVARRCAEDARPLGGAVTVRPMPIVRADPTLLRQVFQNLITNGLKFGRPGVGAEVHVSSVRTPEGWQFEVRDNGRGIKPGDAARVFDPFWRGQGDGAGGHGIGLATCQRALARLGGHIWIESTSPAGTCIRFSLPEA